MKLLEALSTLSEKGGILKTRVRLQEKITGLPVYVRVQDTKMPSGMGLLVFAYTIPCSREPSNSRSHSQKANLSGEFTRGLNFGIFGLVAYSIREVRFFSLHVHVVCV